MQYKTVTVIGGSGFVGSYIIKELLKRGYLVKAASRYPDDSLFLKTAGQVGQLSLIKCNIKNIDSLKKAISGSDIVINTVGVLFDKNSNSFNDVHLKGAVNIAKICKDLDTSQLIHISSLGVERAKTSKYANSKLEAEKNIKKIFPVAVIVRPSLVFGFEDNFFNKFAKIAKFSPFLPIFGGGKTKFKPVYVNDIARAISIIIEKKHHSQTYELVGPREYSYEKLMKYILKTIAKNRLIVNMPFFAGKIMAFFINLGPGDILTVDQLRLLQYDSIESNDKKILLFKDLNIKPSKLEEIVPKYLKRYR